MRVPRITYRKRWFAGIGALVVTLALVLAGCGGTGATPSPTPTTGTSTPTTALTDPAHWGPIIGLGANETVEDVSLGHLLGDASQQALVCVRVGGAGGSLNMYLYDQISSAQPNLIFKLKGLLRGDARLSPANTLLTSQATEAADSSSVPNVYREFIWSLGAHTFVQMAYAGMFPDLTRWQAEADQAQVDAGKMPWKLSATQVAAALASTFLQWPPNAPTTLVSGGGPQASQAVVQVTRPSPMKTTITVTLQRFDEVTTDGIWEVTGVQGESWLTMTAPSSGDTISSPVTVTGTGQAYEGHVGKVVTYDRLYAAVGEAKVMGEIGMGETPFTTTLTYSTDFQGGVQEGIVVLYDSSGGLGGPPPTAVFAKVLLGA